MLHSFGESAIRCSAAPKLRNSSLLGWREFLSAPRAHNTRVSAGLDFLSYEATRSGLTCWFGFCSGVA